MSVEGMNSLLWTQTLLIPLQYPRPDYCCSLSTSNRYHWRHNHQLAPRMSGILLHHPVEIIDHNVYRYSGSQDNCDAVARFTSTSYLQPMNSRMNILRAGCSRNCRYTCVVCAMSRISRLWASGLAHKPWWRKRSLLKSKIPSRGQVPWRSMPVGASWLK